MSTEKAKIRRTITDVGYAPITAISDDGVPTYGTVTWFPHHKAGGRDYDAQPAGNSGSVWADGREVYAYEDNQGYNITLTTVGVTDDIDEDWYGRTVLQDGTVEEYTSDSDYPYFALFIIEDTTDGVGETNVFYFCHVAQRNGQQGATSEGNGLNPQFPQHNISARPRLDCFAVKATIPGKTKLNSVPTPTKAGNHVNILQSAVSVPVGKTVKLIINDVHPADASITWTSGTGAKATVSTDGTVTGVATGTSVITATITVGGTDYTDTCTVTVVSAS